MASADRNKHAQSLLFQSALEFSVKMAINVSRGTVIRICVPNLTSACKPI